MLLFLSGSCTYDKSRNVTRSPLTNVFRVFVVSTTKMCETFPPNPKFYKQNDRTPETFGRTRCFRFLEKAAIDPNPGYPIKNKWRVCTVTEVEEAKIIVRMIPMWMTLIVCGIVSSLRNTYFVEQASHLDLKIGKWNLPIQMYLLVSQGANFICSSTAKVAAKKFLFRRAERSEIPVQNPDIGGREYVSRFDKKPAVGIGFAVIFYVLCCITAARTEKVRLGVIRRNDLLEKPEDDIPMVVYWLLSQFFVVSMADAFLNKSLVAFLEFQGPDSMKDYLEHLTAGVSGLGYMTSVVSVYLVGRTSERGGRPNWFQFTLNTSRLDKYYWVLAVLSVMNFFVFVAVAWFYSDTPYIPNEEVEVEDIGEDLPDGKSSSC